MSIQRLYNDEQMLLECLSEARCTPGARNNVFTHVRSALDATRDEIRRRGGITYQEALDEVQRVMSEERRRRGNVVGVGEDLSEARR